MQSLQPITANLRNRLRLIRIALTKRFIYNEIVEIAREYGMTYEDVRGDVEPLQWISNRLDGRSMPQFPDYSILGTIDDFHALGEKVQTRSEPEIAQFLGNLICLMKATTVLEVGCFLGWATSHMALALQDQGNQRTLTCCDINPLHLKQNKENLAKRKLGHLVNYVAGRSDQATTLKQLPKEADLIFLDTSHEHPQTLHEIKLLLTHLAPQGVIALHDAIHAPGVRRSLGELDQHIPRLTLASSRGPGLTLLSPTGN